jgi:hypothetical protein
MRPELAGCANASAGASSNASAGGGDDRSRADKCTRCHKCGGADDRPGVCRDGRASSCCHKPCQGGRGAIAHVHAPDGDQARPARVA